MGKAKRNETRALSIDLASGREKDLFAWFLACLLFGKPIQTEIAEQAYRELTQAGMTSPDAILKAGWDRLVELLDRAHYVRYDYSTATKLLEVSEALKEKYGSVSHLLDESKTAAELSHKLQELKHIGPVTARIFVREVRPVRYARHKPAGKKHTRQAA